MLVRQAPSVLREAAPMASVVFARIFCHNHLRLSGISAMAKPSEPPCSIPEDVVRFAQSQVSAGRFASVDDVLRAGVEAIQQREEAAEDWLAYARDAWSRGVQSLDAGKAVLTTDEEFEAFLDDCVPPDPH